MFRTEHKLKSHDNISKDKDFCVIVRRSKKDNTLESNQYMKSDKIPYIIYYNTEFLLKKLDGHANNWANSSTAKIGEHIPCEKSMSTI